MGPTEWTLVLVALALLIGSIIIVLAAVLTGED